MLNYTPVGRRPQPDNFHAIQQEKSKLLNQLGKIREYVIENGMQLNYKKTKLILFNPCPSTDFLPDFELVNHAIEMVDETRLLGLVIRSDLSWCSNTDSMVERCNKKL